MVAPLDLWFPVPLSAVLVFVASSVVRTVLRSRWKDRGKLPPEDGLICALLTTGTFG